ncbi:MAG: ABC transporter permease subunit, partial [Pirellulales bacterium]|nr:ABC transporter permease subunit [Pirellulales bacterium]
MITGPIFRVELVSAARRRRYFALRVLYSAIILFVLWVTYESVAVRVARSGDQMRIAQMAEAAANFFYTFSWVQIIGILLVAPAMAVGTIATERERRTIEYLFTTDLSNVEIVLGKTIARLLLIGQLVLASLPILFIFRLLGGIPANLLAASFLISASTALVVTAISVCISVWSPRARDAAMRVYRVLAVLVLGPIVALPLLSMMGANSRLVLRILDAVNFLWEINPLVVLGQS